MPMPELPPPVKVSPIIKIFRYTFLIAGILYGASKRKAFELIEAGKQDEKERRKAEKAAKLEEEKRAANERDIAQIIEIFIPKKPENPTEGPELQSGKGDLNVSEVRQTFIKKENSVSSPSDFIIPEETYTPPPIADAETVVESDQGDIFSSSLNLGVPETEDTGTVNTEQEPFTSTVERDEDTGYFIETFTDGIPFKEPETSEAYRSKDGD